MNRTPPPSSIGVASRGPGTRSQHRHRLRPRLRHFWAIFIEISMSCSLIRPSARKSLRNSINIGAILSIQPRPTVSENLCEWNRKQNKKSKNKNKNALNYINYPPPQLFPPSTALQHAALL